MDVLSASAGDQGLYCSDDVGASYVGLNLEFKKKCPMYETLFNLRLAHPQLEVPKGYWDSRKVGECDFAERSAPRGCCSEALAFMLSVAAEVTSTEQVCCRRLDVIFL